MEKTYTDEILENLRLKKEERRQHAALQTWKDVVPLDEIRIINAISPHPTVTAWLTEVIKEHLGFPSKLPSTTLRTVQDG